MSSGFCASADLVATSSEAGFTLSPGRYVGAPAEEEDEVAFATRLTGLAEQLAEELATNERLAADVRQALAAAGNDI